MNLTEVLNNFPLKGHDQTIAPLGNGLINHTWKVTTSSKENFVLQRINTNVFKFPADIACNIRTISDYFKINHSDYLFIAPLKTVFNEEIYCSNDHEFYRLFPFLPGSQTIDVVSNTSQAFEAARQFALFTKLLSALQPEKIKITLPDFHNLNLRYAQFLSCLENGNPSRIKQSKELIDYLIEQKSVVNTFEAIKMNPDFKTRVMHHDTKISNVLFDQKNKGLCIIDLDTVMPGYFISDVGDMMRTFLSPVSEEEKDLSKIEIRDDYFFAIVKGYLSEMGEELTNEEKNHFVYAGKYMIYMQALRFISDYINNDIYYGAKYENHNLFRAKNQVVLLQKLVEKENYLSQELKGTIAPSI